MRGEDFNNDTEPTQERRSLHITRPSDPGYAAAAAEAAAAHVPAPRPLQQPSGPAPRLSGREFLLQLAARYGPHRASHPQQQQQQQQSTASRTPQQHQLSHHRPPGPANAALQAPLLSGPSLVARWPWHLMDGISWAEVADMPASAPATHPPVSQGLWRATLEPLIEAMAAGTDAAWKAWCLLPSLFFIALPSRRSEARAMLEARMRDWETGAWEPLLTQRRGNMAAVLRARRIDKQRLAADPVAAAIRRADRLVAMGEVGRAAQALAHPEPPAVISTTPSSRGSALDIPQP